MLAPGLPSLLLVLTGRIRVHKEIAFALVIVKDRPICGIHEHVLIALERDRLEDSLTISVPIMSKEL